MIIAIDPGPTQSAFLVWDGGEVVQSAIEPNEQIRQRVFGFGGCTLAVEMIACYGMPVGAETFETCLFIGRLQEIWLSRKQPLHLIYRRDIKMHLCGSARAKDGNIRQALIDKLGVVGTKKNQGPLYGVSTHLWAALAVANYTEEVLIGKGSKRECAVIEIEREKV